MRGRKPKPTKVLQVQGTTRRCRHDRRKREPKSGGAPTRPAWIKGEARKFWERVVPQLMTMGIVESIDVDELAQLSTAWANWRREQSEYEAGDSSIYKVTTAMKAWSSLASNYGFSPADRIRLAGAGTNSQADEDPLISILRDTG